MNARCSLRAGLASIQQPAERDFDAGVGGDVIRVNSVGGQWSISVPAIELCQQKPALAGLRGRDAFGSDGRGLAAGGDPPAGGRDQPPLRTKLAAALAASHAGSGVTDVVVERTAGVRHLFAAVRPSDRS
jgi:hypothetical protein